MTLTKLPEVMTKFANETEARRIADACQNDDPGAIYDVVMRPDCWFVVAVIEDGEFLGCL